MYILLSPSKTLPLYNLHQEDTIQCKILGFQISLRSSQISVPQIKTWMSLASATSITTCHADSVKSLFHSICIFMYSTENTLPFSPGILLLESCFSCLCSYCSVWSWQLTVACSGLLRFWTLRGVFLAHSMRHSVHTQTHRHTHSHTLLNTKWPIQPCNFCPLSHEGALTPSETQRGWGCFGKDSWFQECFFNPQRLHSPSFSVCEESASWRWSSRKKHPFF